jgi:methyl-accepting chemotaxis protein
MDKIIQQSTDIYTKMIETQVVVQSYINDLNSGTATVLKKNISDLENNAKKLGKNQNDEKIAASFGAIAKSIHLYLDSFNQLSSMQKIIGDSSNSGLRKSMNNNIQTLQKLAKAENDSDLKQQLDLLELYQNTYISNPEDSNYKAAKKAIKKFDSLLTHSTLSQKDKDKVSNELLNYTGSLDTVHQSYESMKELNGDFSATTQQVNENVSSIAKQLAKEKQDIIHHRTSLTRLLTVILIIASVIGIGLLCIFGWWLLRSIKGSIASLKHGAAIIGEGNLAHRVELRFLKLSSS